jgi:hypothetical protein
MGLTKMNSCSFVWLNKITYLVNGGDVRVVEEGSGFRDVLVV